MMSDILCAAKNSKGKGIQELSLAEDAMSWFESESSFTFEIATELIELRNSLRKEELFL